MLVLDVYWNDGRHLRAAASVSFVVFDPGSLLPTVTVYFEQLPMAS